MMDETRELTEAIVGWLRVSCLEQDNDRYGLLAGCELHGVLMSALENDRTDAAIRVISRGPSVPKRFINDHGGG